MALFFLTVLSLDLSRQRASHRLFHSKPEQEVKMEVGNFAEAVDEYGIWHKCHIEEVRNEQFMVSFPGWEGYDRS
mgnify:CR=1 FL=1